MLPRFQGNSNINFTRVSPCPNHDFNNKHPALNRTMFQRSVSYPDLSHVAVVVAVVVVVVVAVVVDVDVVDVDVVVVVVAVVVVAVVVVADVRPDACV